MAEHTATKHRATKPQPSRVSSSTDVIVIVNSFMVNKLTKEQTNAGSEATSAKNKEAKSPGGREAKRRGDRGAWDSYLAVRMRIRSGVPKELKGGDPEGTLYVTVFNKIRRGTPIRACQ